MNPLSTNDSRDDRYLNRDIKGYKIIAFSLMNVVILVSKYRRRTNCQPTLLSYQLIVVVYMA